jgi:ATP-dependent RNA helicase DDX56/DBP9
LDKFIILFTFLKLGILEGKTLIYTSDVIQAYRIKLFLNRFALKAFVLSPELPKNQLKSLIHFFHIGQFSILIVVQSGYSHQPQFSSVTNIVNFDVPRKYHIYKENGSHIDSDQGAMLTLIQPSNAEETEALTLCQRKMQKAFSQQNMIKCIPILWQELIKIKSRVEDVTRTLDNKTVKMEKTNEFKKQLVSNKRLREYFNQHPEEKEILINDLQKNDISSKNKVMYKHLNHLPFYVIPQ